MVFKKGYMYKLSISPSATLYVCENKTLVGKENKGYDGEAMGRNLSIAFFEAAPGPGDLGQQMNRESLALSLQLLTIAEIPQTCGFTLPPDPERFASANELLLEEQYLHLDIERFGCDCSSSTYVQLEPWG